MHRCEIRKYPTVVFAGFIFFLVISPACFAFFSGGTGEPNDPYQIETAEQLLQIGSDANLLDKCFILNNDIDLDPNVTGLPPFTQAPLAPDISSSSGFQGIPFIGTFDGNNHKVQFLVIDTNNPDNDFLGLFGEISTGGCVKNVAIESSQIINNSAQFNGAICGSNYGMIKNCSSSGIIVGSNRIGGLCGSNYGSIVDAYTTCEVTGSSIYIGGLCGYNSGSISNCNSSLKKITGFSYVGGLCGKNSGNINNSYSTSTVTKDDHYGESNNIGGLCGDNDGSINICYATRPITGEKYTGGLCGINSGDISSSFATGATIRGDDYTGGFCGENRGIIFNCYATGRVIGSGGCGGGFIGLDSGGNITNCYATGTVTAGFRYAGGFCGFYSSGYITNCYSTGLVNDTWDYGGFCGGSNLSVTGVINGCYFLDTSGPDNNWGQPLTHSQMIQMSSYIGWDFIGQQYDGTASYWIIEPYHYPELFFFHEDFSEYIFNGQGTNLNPYSVNDANDLGAIWQKPYGCYSLSDDIDLSGIQWSLPVIPLFKGIFDGNDHTVSSLSISGAHYLALFGQVESEAEIYDLSINDVNIIGLNKIGALCGWNFGSIVDCNTSGKVTGNTTIGGLCGHNNGVISNSYSSTTIISSSSTGGFCGLNYGYINNCSSDSFVFGDDDSYTIGGLCGRNFSNINNCFTFGSVNGHSGIGGLCGVNSGEINNCFATSSVIGFEDVGGLCGINFENLNRCYSTGSVSGTNYVGGLCGSNKDTINYSYFLDTAGPDNGLGTPLTHTQMKQQASFVSWDFNDIWAICEGMNHPRLQWQIPTADWLCPDGVDFADYSFFSNHWMMTDCNDFNDCNSTDLDFSGSVDADDLDIFTTYWLFGK